MSRRVFLSHDRGPGFDAISSEAVLSFPMNDVAVEIRVLVDRIITEDPPH